MNKPGFGVDDQLKRFIDERKDSFAHTTKRIYPDKTAGKVDIGRVCRYWYQRVHDNADSYIKSDPEILPLMVFIIDFAYMNGLNLDDPESSVGNLWRLLLKYYYEIGLSYRNTMDETKDEKVRLGTRL